MFAAAWCQIYAVGDPLAMHSSACIAATHTMLFLKNIEGDAEAARRKRLVAVAVVIERTQTRGKDCYYRHGTAVPVFQVSRMRISISHVARLLLVDHCNNLFSAPLKAAFGEPQSG
jgi:hypothetical protein